MSNQLGGLNSHKAWRVWVTKHPVGAAVWAGVVAGQITTLWGIWFPGVGLPALDWPQATGATIDAKGSFPVQFVLGEFFHGLDCIIFALIFAIFLFPLLGKVVTPAMNMAKAVGFGMVLATISAAFLVPYVYFKGYGVGFGGIHYGGWKLVFAVYLWHLLYGVNLGVFYDPLPLNDPALL
jgi:hypothetical protein